MSPTPRRGARCGAARRVLTAALVASLYGAALAVKNVTMTLPEAVAQGDAVTLRCDYDLDGQTLYSIKWFRGESEFYQYVPKEIPPTKVFNVDGVKIDVDMSRSDANRVMVRDVAWQPPSYYRCEVSADAPTFHTGVQTGLLTVIGQFGMDTSSESEGEPPQRSRSTQYRWLGSRKRRLEVQNSSSSDDEANAVHLDPAPVEADEADAPVDNEHLNADEAPNENDELRSDSDWSEELDAVNGSGDEDGIDQQADEDYDPDEEDFVAVGGAGNDSDEENEEPHFGFTHESLNRVLQFRTMRTVKESLLISLALSVRHKQDYESLLNNQKALNLLLGSNYFPTTKKALWNILGRTSSGIVAHVYCRNCHFYIGKKKRLGDQITCPICSVTVAKEAAKYFFSISLNAQLEHFLSKPGVAEALQYREKRIKHSENAIEDMYDAEYYRSIKVDGHELMNSMNYTLTINTDGCKIRKGGRDHIVPVYARINEVSPKLRQKFMFLVGMFVDVQEPNMQCYLKPIVTELNSLSNDGLLWKPDGQVEVRSKFITICHCVDGKAKWQIMNMTSHCGYHSCTQCTYRGIRVNNTMRYPCDHPDLPPHVMRTHIGMLSDMREAETQVPRPESVRGHKGATPLALLSGFDLVKGNAFDDLHYFYECAAFHNTKLILDEARRVDRFMGRDTLCTNIDQRMKRIKTPSCISRKPGNCLLKNLSQMSGTELRNWLVYAAVPCLQGLVHDNYIKHLELVSHAVYLLSMDIITEADLEKSEQFIKLYLQQYEVLFGIERTRLNLHSLLHAPNSVRLLGPLWCTSTFNFESWNHNIIQLVTSPKGIMSQIVTRYLLCISLEMVLVSNDDDIGEDVKQFVAKILHKRRREDGREVGAHTYLLGTPKEREPTNGETNILALEGLQCTGNLAIYDKVSIRSVDYRTARTHDASFKSDDTTVFTYQNTFCTIQDIVTFTDQEDREICGLFVMEHSVIHPSPFSRATHIKQMLPEAHDLPHFIQVQEVRSPVVKVFVNNNRYFIPLPNTTEID